MEETHGERRGQKWKEFGTREDPGRAAILERLCNLICNAHIVLPVL